MHLSLRGPALGSPGDSGPARRARRRRDAHRHRRRLLARPARHRAQRAADRRRRSQLARRRGTGSSSPPRAGWCVPGGDGRRTAGPSSSARPAIARCGRSESIGSTSTSCMRPIPRSRWRRASARWRSLQRAGKIRWIGLSNVSVDEIERARSHRADPHGAEPAQPVLPGGAPVGGRRALRSRTGSASWPTARPAAAGSTSSCPTIRSWPRWPGRLGVSAHAIVLAWVLSKSPTVILIPSARRWSTRSTASDRGRDLKLLARRTTLRGDRRQAEFLAGPRRRYCHRISVAPTVNPAPTATNTTRSPRRIRPRASASSSASGIVAAVVLP